MICNVCKHPVRSLGKEWKCDEGCRCLMLGCVAVSIPQPNLGDIQIHASAIPLIEEMKAVEYPKLNVDARTMRMPCMTCGRHDAPLGQAECPPCALASFRAKSSVIHTPAMAYPVRQWVDNVELMTYTGDATVPPRDWCNCTDIHEWHPLGSTACIHMKPSTGAVNR